METSLSFFIYRFSDKHRFIRAFIDLKFMEKSGSTGIGAGHSGCFPQKTGVQAECAQSGPYRGAASGLTIAEVGDRFKPQLRDGGADIPPRGYPSGGICRAPGRFGIMIRMPVSIRE